jgi:DNA-directed RNA polymerase subunit RPC12/RpoP
MEQNLKPEERELIKLVQYFKKRAQVLITENKLDEDYRQMLETCDKLTEQLHQHAKNREIILAEREQLQGMIKDNAKCPKCSSNEMLKVIGFDTTAQGWKSNKYKCRRCNIAFVWNTPNNPWDMIPYVEKFINDTEEKIAGLNSSDPEHEATLLGLEQMKANVAKLKPVAEASDLDMKDLEERELQMADLVRKFKKHLMIEKIKMED